jgi:glycosyltransferase involved in cell wall biosynthesis
VEDLVSRRKIRVLQLIDGFALAGAERVVLTLAANLDRKEFDVIPCALRRSGPLEEELRTAGINYRVLGLRRRSVLTGPLFISDLRRTIRALRKILGELSIDIVHTHLTESTLAGILAARHTRGLPVCATLHNILLHHQRGRLSPREWLMRTAINQVFSKADCLIAVSEEVSQAVRLHTKIPEERVLTIPNGIDSKRFHVTECKDALRKTLDLPTDRQIVVTVGRLTRQKGYPHLIAALGLMAPAERPLTLIIGDGSDRDQLDLLIRTNGLSNDVRLLGNRLEVPDFLGAADLFVLPSLWEGLPLALLEAAASGLPVVVTAVGGNTEVVKNGESGLLVQPGDEKGMAEAIASLLADPVTRGRMGKEARKRFDRRYGLASFIEAHERCYRRLLDRPPDEAGQREEAAQEVLR